MTIEEKAKERIRKELQACGYTGCDTERQIFRFFTELKESEDERIRKEIIEFLRLPHRQFVGKRNHEEWIDWLEKQGEFKSSKWTEGDVVRHGGVLALVTNGRNAMKSNCEQITIQYPDEWVKAETKERKYFFEELEKQGEQKPANNDKHEYEEIINGIIDFVTYPNLLLPNRKQEYITFLENMKENGRRIHFSRKVKSEKQVVLITESNGNAYIDWDTRSLEDTRKLLECGLRYINTELGKQGEQKQDPCEHCQDVCLNCHNFPCIVKRAFEQGKSVFEVMNEEKVDNANKVVVEPKFKVGDWITNGDYTWKIVEVKPLDYILQSQDGNIVDDTISHVDEQFHSFTIKDARDGDVLALSYASQNYILIYKGLHEKDFNTMMSVFCSYYVEENRYDDETDNFHAMNCGEIITPATKKQRDILIKAMNDAGYTFDFEKKELKEIEQKPTDNDKIEALRTEYEKGRADAIAEMQVAWSDEDEVELNGLIKHYEDGHVSTPQNRKTVKWLKTLKDRVGCEANIL